MLTVPAVVGAVSIVTRLLSHVATWPAAFLAFTTILYLRLVRRGELRKTEAASSELVLTQPDIFCLSGYRVIPGHRNWQIESAA